MDPSTKPEVGLMTLPAEIRLMILRLVIPEEYDIEVKRRCLVLPGEPVYKFNYSQGVSQNPSLSLLLVNRQINADTTSLESLGSLYTDRIASAVFGWKYASEAKRKHICRVKLARPELPVTVQGPWHGIENNCICNDCVSRLFLRSWETCTIEKCIPTTREPYSHLDNECWILVTGYIGADWLQWGA